MKHNSFDTIAAFATPLGKGGIGIIRISGPHVPEIAKALLGKLPQPRYAIYTPFFSADQTALDQGIALYFSAPDSFTGEDVLELQGHGGPVVMNMLLQRTLQLGARLANPGEFSERAFLNDKIDLVQAEAIADLIDANSEQAARGALRSLQGEFSQRVLGIKNKLIELRRYVEAVIDFSEEEIDFLRDYQVQQRIIDLLARLTQMSQQAQQGARLRAGIYVVIAGKPNAGKSSLLNYLTQQEIAIVTDIPGTTRDVLRESWQIDGLLVQLIDTAGLRQTDHVVEQHGIQRTLQEIAKADRILWITEAAQLNWAQELELLQAEFPTIALPRDKITLIRNKVDLLDEQPAIQQDQGLTSIALSAKTGLGVELLKAHLKETAGFANTTENLFIARERHWVALNQATMHVRIAQQLLQENNGIELIAEELALAQRNLSDITGEFRVDDLLGEIFSNFCVGK